MHPAFSLNWIDAAVLFSVLVSIYIGIKTGALGLMVISSGFYISIFFGGWLLPKVIPIKDRTLLTIVITNLVVSFGLIACVYSFKLNKKLHLSVKDHRLKALDTISGGVLASFSTTIFLWILLPAIIWMPFVGLSNQANKAFTTQLIRKVLPKAPAVINTFNSEVNPNNPPYLFYDRQDEVKFEYDRNIYNQIINKAADSVVNIAGFGCGGQISGSGFVADDHLVITNAHVIAGMTRPIVKQNGKSYESVPILFDSNLDFAALKIIDPSGVFKAPILQLMKEPLADDTTVAILGYPNSKFSAAPGVLQENRNVYGRNIYDVGYYGRNIYAVQAQINYGSSGGPVIAPDGRVAGVIFAKDSKAKDISYALASNHLISPLDEAKLSNTQVGLGVCLAK